MPTPIERIKRYGKTGKTMNEITNEMVTVVESALHWRRFWCDVKDEIEMETGCDCDVCSLMRACDEYMEQAEFKKEDYKHMIIYEVSNDSSSVLFKFKKDAEDYKSSHSGLCILERYVFGDSELTGAVTENKKCTCERCTGLPVESLYNDIE